MRFYHVIHPANYGSFAMCAHVGTWKGPGECPECGQCREHLVPPHVIENHQAGSADLADFAWCGFGIYVTDDCATRLRALRLDLRFWPVKIRTARGMAKARDRDPFRGGVFHHVCARRVIELDSLRSGFGKYERCRTCKQPLHGFRRNGLVVRARDVDASKSFRIDGYDPSIVYLTEAGAKRFRAQGFSNVELREAGVLA